MEDYYKPIAKMGENLLVWSGNAWHGYVIDYQEHLPLASPSIIDFGAVAASGTVASSLVASLQLELGYLIQMWMKPLDDIEIVLWLVQGQQRFRIRDTGFRVSIFTGIDDPHWLTTEFAAIGTIHDPYLEIRNPSAYALATSLIAFWGNKYIIKKADVKLEAAMLSGDKPASRIVAEAKIA